MSDLCFQQQATVKVVTTDRYRRSVADVECRSKDAGAEQVRPGMAWVYRQYAKGYDSLYPIEQDAKHAKRGLWQDTKAVPPWEWRKAAKDGRAPVVAGESTCYTGPRGGHYTITLNGKKKYACSAAS